MCPRLLTRSLFTGQARPVPKSSSWLLFYSNIQNWDQAEAWKHKTVSWLNTHACIAIPLQSCTLGVYVSERWFDSTKHDRTQWISLPYESIFIRTLDDIDLQRVGEKEEILKVAFAIKGTSKVSVLIMIFFLDELKKQLLLPVNSAAVPFSMHGKYYICLLTSRKTIQLSSRLWSNILTTWPVHGNRKTHKSKLQGPRSSHCTQRHLISTS